MSATDMSYKESVLLDVAMHNDLMPEEATFLPKILERFVSKAGMSESEMLWHLATNKELSEYAAEVARKVNITNPLG